MRRFLIIPAISLVLIGGVWLARVPLVQYLANWASEHYAPLPVSFVVQRLDHTRLTLEAIKIGHENPVIIDRVDIGFSVEHLRNNRIASLAIDGVSMPVTASLAGDVRVAGIDPLAQEQSADTSAVLPDWTIETLSVDTIAVSAKIDQTIDVNVAGRFATTGPLELTALPVDDPFALIDLIEGAVSIAINTDSNAPLLSDLPLSNVTAKGAMDLTIETGLVTLATSEPITVRSDQGSVDVTIALNGDGVIRRREDVSGSVSAKFSLIQIPVPELDGNKAFLTGFAVADIADGFAQIRIGRGSSTGVSGLPVDTSDWPEPFQEFGIGVTVVKDLTAVLPLSGIPDDLAVTGDLVGTYGPLYATLHGPTHFRQTENTVTMDVPKIELDILKAELFGKAVRSLNSISNVKVDLNAVSATGTLETDTTISDDTITLDADVTGRIAVSPAKAEWFPSGGGHIVFSADKTVVDAVFAETETGALTFAFDPQAVVGDFSLDTLSVKHDGASIDIPDTALAGRYEANTASISVDTPALFVDNTNMLAGPINLDATVQRTSAGNMLDGTLTTGPGLSAIFHAYHTEKVPVIHTVTGNLEVSPLTFEEGGLQPSDVFPFLLLSGPFSGEVSSETNIIVDPDKPATGLIKLHMKDGAFRNPVIDFTDITEVFEFPIKTLPGSRVNQSVSGTVSVTPLRQAPFNMVYTVNPDLGVDIASLSIDGFGGRFGVKNLTIQPDRASAEGVIFVDAIDFEALTRLADIEGFHADGVLTGEIPFQVKNGRLIAPSGELRALGSGRLSYTSPALDAAAKTDSQVELLVQALKDFRYSALTLDTALPAQGDGTILLKLQGHNPDVLNGHPFNLNINLENNFNKLASDLYAIYEQAFGFFTLVRKEY